MYRRLPLKISGLVAGAVLATVTGHTANAEDWKFAIEEIQGSVQDRYAQEFKKRIEEKTNGEVTVTIYPYGALGTSAELTELVTQGAIQFADASPGHLGTLVPEIQVFSIPSLLSDNNEVNKKVLTESPVIYETLQEDFHDKGLHLLTMYPEGEMVWTTNKEIRSPEDFEVQEEYNQERLEKIKQEKPDMQMIELTDEEREAFRERSMQAREAFVEMTGEDGQQILDALVADIEAAEQEVGTN
jgi:TRAP-type C4-dicarboxylate transport system substrate-binding protein